MSERERHTHRQPATMTERDRDRDKRERELAGGPNYQRDSTAKLIREIMEGGV